MDTLSLPVILDVWVGESDVELVATGVIVADPV